MKYIKYTKSLNCESCAAPLVKSLNSNLSKCLYCRNTNIILDNGSTKIYHQVIPLVKPVPKKQEELKYNLILIIVFMIVPVLFYYFYKRFNTKDKETKIHEKGGEVIGIST